MSEIKTQAPATQSDDKTADKATATQSAAKAKAKSATGSGAKAAAGKAPAKEKTVTVVGPREGRRRAGRRFGAEPVVIPVSELKKGEIEALKADPSLLVSEE